RGRPGDGSERRRGEEKKSRAGRRSHRSSHSSSHSNIVGVGVVGVVVVGESVLTERGEEEAEAGALPPRRPGKKAPAPRAPEMGTRRRKHPRAEEEEEGEEGKKNLESGGGGRRGQEEKRGERERLP
ncbi:hypothetical protein EG866_15835, partial [Enterococcus faecalis]